MSYLPTILEWGDGLINQLIDSIEAEYTQALHERFAIVSGHLFRAAPDEARSVLDELARLDSAAFQSLLRRPETSRRLTLHERYQAQSTIAYLRSALAVASPRDSTSAVLGWRLRPPDAPGDAAPRPTYKIADRLERVAELVASSVPGAMAMILRCTREIHVQSDDSLGHFRSNSPQGRVGRVVLTNCEEADDVALAEALVHEATHGLVGMSEAIGLVRGAPYAWFDDPYPYDGVSRVRSPWTGTQLDVPTYLHANFVWYGLFGFWARAYGCKVWLHDRVRTRIYRAMRGFLDGAAVAEIEPFRGVISPKLFDVLTEMSSTVLIRVEDALS